MIVESSRQGCHIAIFANPERGRGSCAVEVIEELVRRGHRVTYITGADVAYNLTLAGVVGPSWFVVGCLDDSSAPAAVARGFMEEDQPQLVVYDASARATARGFAGGWGLPSVCVAVDHPDGVATCAAVEACLREY